MTGNQFKAARILIGMEQTELAELAGLNVNTIRNMESAGPTVMRVRLDTLHKAKAALEAKGVQFLDAGQVAAGPGVTVRLKVQLGSDTRA